VDTSINGAFFLDQNSYNVSSRVISAFDPTHFVMVGICSIGQSHGRCFRPHSMGTRWSWISNSEGLLGQRKWARRLAAWIFCSAAVVCTKSCAFHFCVIPRQRRLSW